MAEEDIVGGHRTPSFYLDRKCRRAKERLSSHREADVTVVHPDTGAAISATVTRDGLEDLPVVKLT